MALSPQTSLLAQERAASTQRTGGTELFVSPQPIDDASIFSTKWGGFAGPALEVSRRFGDTSGRFGVAQIIARVFPAYKSFVMNVEKSDPGAGLSFSFGPYPSDALTYKSNRVVEHKTSAQNEGLGTYHSSLKKNGSPTAVIVANRKGGKSEPPAQSIRN